MVASHELHMLTGSYALDALPDGERAEFEKHLARCPSCAEEVRGLRETAARLALATAIAPPPQLRARVLAAAPHIRQLPPSGRGPLSASGLRRLPLTRAGLTAGIFALAAALVFLLVTNVSTTQRLHQSQASSQAVAAVLAAPDARVESLPAVGGGTVTAVLSLDQRQAVVTSAALPALPASEVYQLWVMTQAGGARSAGLLALSSSGTAQPALAGGVVRGDRLGLTVEPSGGSARPTTKPLVAMPVSA